jgi:hypothetical protein
LPHYAGLGANLIDSAGQNYQNLFPKGPERVGRGGDYHMLSGSVNTSLSVKS